MAAEIDPAITRAIVEVAIFLEFSDEEIVSADASVAALEQLAATLLGSTDATRTILTEQMIELSREFPHAEKFVRELPDVLGIAG